jgi:hypothetical protein
MRIDKELSEKTKDKHRKNIEKLNANVNKKIKDYMKYDLSTKNKAINAYVMFRSMEGQERAIEAYKDGSCTRCCKSSFCC